MTKTVLITGAYGFVGRNVARHFANAGWTVKGMGHGSWAREEWRQWGISEWHTADITLETLSACAGAPDVIVHCAGSGSVGFSMAHPLQDFQRTVETTIAVLEFVRLHAPMARVVHPSSGGVYGVAESIPIKESAPLMPVSPYGVHKKIVEELSCSYAKNFGVASAIVRLFSVYGAGLRKQLLWDACVKIRNGENGFFGSGQETRDWLHVSDAAALLMAAAEHASVECPVVNGGAGQGIRVRDVLSELFVVFGRTDEPAFSGVTRGGDPAAYAADIERARNWGWQPKIQWREGVREYAAWFGNSQP